MKRQNRLMDTEQNGILIDLGKSEATGDADSRPKISSLRVVSTHPLTLSKPDQRLNRFT